MSQYGSASKNPPWVRSGQAMGLNQPSQVGQTLMAQSTMSNMTNPSMLQYPQVFQGQMAAAQQIYGAVQYPTRALNSAAFSSGGGGAAAPSLTAASGIVGSTNSGGQQHSSSLNDQTVTSSSQAKQQRVFTGTVTKVQDNFGFVDNDVFFQSSCCVKGSSPQVGDRVLVEAVYNSNMPFKWNATRIQVLPVAGGSNQQQQQQHHQQQQQSSRQPFTSSQSSQSQIYSAVPPPSQHNDMGGGGGGGGGSSSSRFSSRFSSNDRGATGRDRSRDVARDRARHQHRDQDEDRKRRRDDSRNRNERDDKERGKSPVRRRSKSPPRNVARRSTQPRRRPPRYSVVVPRYISLASTEADVVELRKRYKNLYIPSDFFLSKLSWTETFPNTKPLSLDLPCNFYVMHKDVDPLEEVNAVYEPSDADYLYSAKVMLFSSPGLDELYSKCCPCDDHSEGKSTSEEDSPSPTSTHPSRLLSFLVGTRNKEFLAIGGPWSPSLDGPDPASDSGVLVKTAVRTCKALTGIDLSACTQWFRFLEVHYHRSETTHHGRPVPARVETVVIFVPDVWSIGPSQLGWDEITAGFKTALANKLNPPPEPGDSSTNNNNNNNNNNNSSNNTSSNNNHQSSDEHKEERAGSPEKVNTESKKEPKHHSELDPKNMRVSELREELEARCLSPKGLKTQLAARLAKVIKTEAEEEHSKKSGDVSGDNGANKGNDNDENSEAHKENSEATTVDLSLEEAVPSTKSDASPHHHSSILTDKKKKEDETDVKEKKKLDDREKMLLEKRYRLPDTPHIIVHPSRTFKAGKFDCAVVSLPALLGYLQDDTKEHAFEVSLFAELFNEMLMRDFGFNIYRALLAAPERAKEEKSRDKDDDRKKDKPKEKESDKDCKEGEKEKESEKSKNVKEEKKEKGKDKEVEKDKDKMDVDLVEDEDTKENSTKKDDDKKKEAKKLVKVLDLNLMLSFTYFDTNRVGYLYDRDLEDLLFSLGLALSRSQLRKLVQKVAKGDLVYYRKLAEKTKEEGAENDKTDQAALDDIIWDNKMLLPSAYTDTAPGTPSRKKKQELPNTAKKTASGMVEYNGTLIDVGKLMDQLSRSEHTRIETEKSLAKLRNDYNKLKESSSRSERYIKDLTSDIKDYKERLYNSNSELCTLESKQKQFYSTITDIHEMIRPLLKSSSSSSHSSSNDPDVIEVKREDNGARATKRRKIEVSSLQPTEIVEIKEDDSSPVSVVKAEPTTIKSEPK